MIFDTQDLNCFNSIKRKKRKMKPIVPKQHSKANHILIGDIIIGTQDLNYGLLWKRWKKINSIKKEKGKEDTMLVSI